MGPSDAEYFDAAMRAPLLQRLAEETGGRFFRAADTSSLVDAITYSGRGVTVVEERDLWDMPIVLFLLLGLMGREWLYPPVAGVGMTGCALAVGGRHGRGAGDARRWRSAAGVAAGSAGLGLHAERALRRQVRVRPHGVLRRTPGAADPPWSHDYPVGETHFLNILTAVSNVPAHVEASSVMAFDDPEMFKFPVIYLVEPGLLGHDRRPGEGAARLPGQGRIPDRGRLSRTGRGQQFDFEMSRVFPDGQWQDLDVTHPIFHSFFDIATLDIVPAYPALGEKPIFRAMFEDNDPTKRMYAIANYQNDLSEYLGSIRNGSDSVVADDERGVQGRRESVHLRDNALGDTGIPPGLREKGTSSWTQSQRRSSPWIRPRTSRSPTR